MTSVVLGNNREPLPVSDPKGTSQGLLGHMGAVSWVDVAR